MELFVLFGQRKERYAGENGLEALACMSYYDQDANPDYLPGQKSDYDKTGEFERTEIITLKVDEKALMEILRPTSKTVEAKII